jgi:hypothetical protein
LVSRLITIGTTIDYLKPPTDLPLCQNYRTFSFYIQHAIRFQTTCFHVMFCPNLRRNLFTCQNAQLSNHSSCVQTQVVFPSQPCGFECEADLVLSIGARARLNILYCTSMHMHALTSLNVPQVHVTPAFASDQQVRLPWNRHRVYK